MAATETEVRRKYLLLDEIPRWYALKWHAHAQTIEVTVRREVLLKTSKFSEEWLHRFAEALQIDEFDDLSADKYGFGGALRRAEQGTEIRFFAKLPVSYFVLDEDCDGCNGTKKDEYGDECLYCTGLGKKSEYRYKDAFSVVASIGVLLDSLEYLEGDRGVSSRQLMALTVWSERGGGNFLSGRFGTPLVRWLSALPRGTVLEEVGQAMKDAYYHMFTKRKWDSDRDFWARAEGDGWLNIFCRGEGCGMAPSLNSFGRGHGYEISSHNVDNPVQLLSLLAGLAALHDIAAEKLG